MYMYLKFTLQPKAELRKLQYMSTYIVYILTKSIKC